MIKSLNFFSNSKSLSKISVIFIFNEKQVFQKMILEIVNYRKDKTHTENNAHPYTASKGIRKCNVKKKT